LYAEREVAHLEANVGGAQTIFKEDSNSDEVMG
jgi:hypothetical protein